MSRNQRADKAVLLDKLRKTPIVEVACKQAGVPRSTYYRWRKDDQTFADESDEALEHSSALINDMAESQLISAIKDKNMTAIIFWLKHHHKAYETRVRVDGNLKHFQNELSAEQSQLVAQALQFAGLLMANDEAAAGEVDS